MKTRIALIFGFIVLAIIVQNLERPIKIIFLETSLKAYFVATMVPNPLEDPYGWINGVRNAHLHLRTEEIENRSKDLHIKLKDGSNNFIRIFFPSDYDKNRKDYPVFLWFHGGGYCLGNYSYEDGFLFPLSDRIGALVISVDYRLAPEHKFPAAIQDAYLSFQWIAENIGKYGGDTNKIFVGGESSGASISMVISYLVRESNNTLPEHKIRGIYLNCAGILKFDSDSYKLYRKGYILEEDWIKVFSVSYVKRLEEWRNPMTSPLNLDSLTGLPNALIHISNLDVVRDGNLYLVERLEKENPGKVSWKVFDGIPHAGISSFRWLFTEESDQAIEHINEWVTNLTTKL